MAGKRYDVDMTDGPLFGKIVRFAIPLALAQLLQLTFDAADMAVIGNFSTHESLAAIGATNTLTSMLLTLVFGIAGGANVIAAQSYGARDRRGMNRAVHTSIALAVLCGMLIMVLGLVAARPLLHWTQTPEAILDRATLYLRLRFLGMPFLLIYTFGSVLMRAVGDTKRPLYYLTAAGILNVLLNVFFVVVCRMDVAGVAIATAASKALSAYLVFRALIDNRGPCRLFPRQLRFYPAELKRILWLGIPSGLQSSCYCISNVIIQAAVNSFGAVTIAGNTAGTILETAAHTVPLSMYQTVLSFVGQNYGSGKYDRMARSILICLCCAVSAGFILGWSGFLYGKPLLGIFNSDPGVVTQGMIRLKVAFTTYFIVGALDVVNGGLRGMGRSVAPAAVTLFSVCGFRIFWVMTVFKAHRTLETLYISYPISWAMVVAVNGTMLYILCRRLLRRGGSSGKGRSVAA